MAKTKEGKKIIETRQHARRVKKKIGGKIKTALTVVKEHRRSTPN